MRKYNLFLDDVRIPYDAFNYTKDTDFSLKEWSIVRNYDEFVKFITSNYTNRKMFPGLIAFDHDLADEHYYPLETSDEYQDRKRVNDIDGFYNEKFKEKTGYHCAKWLIDFCLDNNLELPNFKCHSMNPSGRENILGLLNNFKKFQLENKNL